jgi:hypothetical protein
MNRRTVILTLALVFTLVLGAIGAYASWPRHADLRGFEPAEMHGWRRRCGAIITRIAMSRCSAASMNCASLDSFRGQAMTDPDWSEIECRLRRAYRSLKAGG